MPTPITHLCFALLFFFAFSIMIRRLNMWFLVPTPCRKPIWTSAICSSAVNFILFNNILSKILLAWLINAIVRWSSQCTAPLTLGIARNRSRDPILTILTPHYLLIQLLLLSWGKNIVSQSTAASSASCKRSRLPSNLVNGQELTICDIVWISPQSHSSLWVKPHFLWDTLQRPWSVWNRFSSGIDHRSRLPVFPPPTCDINCLQVSPQWFVRFQVKWRRVKDVII